MLCVPNSKERKRGPDTNDDACEPTLAFAVYVLHDLNAGEEAVHRWEWDDGNAVHGLPALFKIPHLFPSHVDSPAQ